jgi:hypothetical protein
MSRYIRKVGRVGLALGPSEERGFSMWVGYDIEDATGDLSALGLTNVDDWTGERLAELGVAGFLAVRRDDRDLRRKLGLEA